MPEPIDYDGLEEIGDAARRQVLIAAEQAGLTLTAAGQLLATLVNGKDQRMAFRALERFLDLGYVFPNRHRRVHIQQDQRILQATVGAGTLAGGITEDQLRRLGPEKRRAALAALDALRELSTETIDHGTSTDPDRQDDRRGDLHERVRQLDADGLVEFHPVERAVDGHGVGQGGPDVRPGPGDHRSGGNYVAGSLGGPE